jgi:ubiquinone/menaquinone biosynthesis C-methylase UbiE
VSLAHLFLGERVRPGDRVVDATCGRGRDTLRLARLVGPTGRVLGFDIQEDALAATRELLEREGCLDRVELMAASHERLAELVVPPLHAAVFNLGYLPGGDRNVITRPAATLAALDGAFRLLVPGGRIVVALYPGHDGGLEESLAVVAWGGQIPARAAAVWHCTPVNRPPDTPQLLVVEKRG